ncbi:MAG: hypothetical protein B6244_03625 [Candidatus Cloacimonetes bacterium 4572_55]|nr:MAG: hypothetical protein B6244_03625 [Candidatus Cloacimonetes bacterium 4572_55]
MPDKNSDKEKSRREFLKQSGWAVVGIAVAGTGLLFIDKNNKNGAGQLLLRPPGVINEEDFLYACIKCGLCIQICPIHAIKLADADMGLSIDTPYIDARQQACDFSCDSLQCAETCPTAALDFIKFKETGVETAIELQPKIDAGEIDGGDVFKIAIANMKKAVHIGFAIVNEKSCLAVQGKGFKGTPRGSEFKGVLRYRDISASKAQLVSEQIFDREVCDLCVIHCPIEGAIQLKEQSPANGNKKWIPEVTETCTGCGVCEMVCPTEHASIVIKPGLSYEEAKNV